MGTGESGGQEKNRSINIVTSREFNTMLVLVRLAKQERNTKKNG
jgi:hypothetical protein